MKRLDFFKRQRYEKLFIKKFLSILDKSKRDDEDRALINPDYDFTYRKDNDRKHTESDLRIKRVALICCTFSLISWQVYVRTLRLLPMPLDEHFQRILQFHRTHQRMPSYQEIAHFAKFRSKFAALRLVNRLIENGRLLKDKTGRLLPTGYFLDILSLDMVVAGWPSLANEGLLDTVTPCGYLIYFLLDSKLTHSLSNPVWWDLTSFL